MANNYFEFKQFTIKQEKAAMKVGTDGVLLGAYADVTNAKDILDIGTGIGLIAIMLAQRSRALVDAIEIEDSAFLEACENVEKCPWEDRIRMLHVALQKFSETANKKYDLIVSNPPFFIDSLHAPDAKRTEARHDIGLTHKELIEHVALLLEKEGRFFIILPANITDEVVKYAGQIRLYCNHQLFIKPVPGKPAKRVISALSFEKTDYTKKEITIEKGERHDYTDEYIELTKDFYLNF
jgi:tRNA1Val (adenine37-N6)-methyltransferase